MGFFNEAALVQNSYQEIYTNVICLSSEEMVKIRNVSLKDLHKLYMLRSKYNAWPETWADMECDDYIVGFYDTTSERE